MPRTDNLKSVIEMTLNKRVVHMWAGLLKDVKRIFNIGNAPFLIIESDQLNLTMWNGGYSFFLRLKKDYLWHR